MAAQQGSLNLLRAKSEREIREYVRNHALSLRNIDLTIVAIGVTGAGKSTLLNILAGKEVFEAAGGVKGITNKVQKEIVTLQTSTIALIDTPGLLDPETLDKAIALGTKTHVLLSQQRREFAAYLEEALHQAGEKVDAFLLVFNAESRWSVEAEWVMDILNTIGVAYQHIILVFTHGDGLGKTNAERCAEMKKRLSDPKADAYGLKDLLNVLKRGRSELQESEGAPSSMECGWIITESNDVRSSGNSDIWQEILEKQRNTKAMYNEDFSEVKHIMVDEEERMRLKHATLQEIAQQEADLCEIEKLKSKVECLEPDVLQLTQKLDEQMKKLSRDFPEAGLTADNDLASFSAKHAEVHLDLQEKRDQLKTQQAEYATLKEKLDSKASEEATRNRQKQAQENQVVLEKAKEYWPQHMIMNRGVEDEEDDRGSEIEGNNDPTVDDGETDQLLH